MKYLMDDVKKWEAVYRLLNMVNTEMYDCGALCSSACCMANNSSEEMGIYLFPGEHRLLLKLLNINIDDANNSDCSAWNSDWLEWSEQDPADLGFPPSWTDPVYFLKCKSAPACMRNIRPLQCRTFPLKPVIGDQGVLELIWNDEELPYECPIIERNMPVHDDFYKATYTVWSHLMRDKRIFELVMMWS